MRLALFAAVAALVAVVLAAGRRVRRLVPEFAP
jgi:hypothetical protein